MVEVVHEHDLLVESIRDEIAQIVPKGDSKVWGPFMWALLEGTVEAIPCPHCRVEAIAFIRAFHDYINAQLGKPMKYPENYKNVILKMSSVKV
ncbi:MAG: hypothetical protein QXD27_09155 [Metallosphaera sp.]